MAARLDPYAELGVPRDASKADIRRAYRSGAKRAHPDAGGSAEKFQKLRRCALVLLDENKRQKFDATGEVEEDAPDNALSHGMQFVSMVISEAIMEAIQNRREPEVTDIVRIATMKLDKKLSDERARVKEFGLTRAFITRATKRVKAKKGKENRVSSLMDGQLRWLSEAEATAERNIAAMIEAQKILADHSYQIDSANGPVTVHLPLRAYITSQFGGF